MRILVASDDDVVGPVLERSLTSQAHAVERASDGEAAWLVIRDDPPDVVVSDWVMPGLDGLGLCRRIREHGAEAYTYFILVTSADRRHNLETAMAAGIDDYLSKPLDMNELRVRLRVAERITGLQRQLAERNDDLEESNRRLFETGRRDPLTELWNRRQLTEDLEQMRVLASRYKRSVCIAICDIDHFKLYNDRYGHVAGDQVLVRVARALQTGSRVCDRVYRFGGEEFVLTFPEVSLDGAVGAMERLRLDVESLGMPHPDAGPLDVLTISAGVSQLARGGDTSVAAWLARTDRALYAAKAAGRNRIVAARPPEPGDE